LNLELDNEILCDDDHPVTKTLIYIYSMETFIYGDLKRACLERDYTRVKNLGPYAKAMGQIISLAFREKLSLDLKGPKKYET
jgi:hypothetical protein